MSTVDRVMKAYASKHDLSPSQAAFVRDELSKFIDDLMSRQRREPTMLPERKDVARLRTSQQGNGTAPRKPESVE